jgi:hypothetical protein
MLAQNMAKLIITLPKKPFQKWGLDFIIPIKLMIVTLVIGTI